MEYQELLKAALNFATAILLGALVGIEREKRKEEAHDARDIAGLRTFSLIALFGAAHSAMPVWPPTGTQQARKPAGGFIDCPVEYLILPW